MISTFLQRFLSLSFFTGLLSLSALSCATSKAVESDTNKLSQSLLWKIEHKDQAQPSYLFGTIHMIPKESFFYPAGLEEAFSKSEDVVFEVDLDDMTGMGPMMGMLSNLMMKDGVTLDELMTKEEYSEVSAYFENMGLPMFLLNKVKPMFLSMLAEINMDPGQMNSDAIVSYEMELYERAQKDKKDVAGLESLEYQMSLFDSIPYKDQAQMLIDAVQSVSTESDMFDETVELYKKQDIEAMVAMMREDGQAAASTYEDVLLKNRNENWIPVMSTMMKKSPVFFAVGAGHLAGDNGVIKLLRKAGYTLTPVSVHRTTATKQKI